jgi:hypothetical protein
MVNLFVDKRGTKRIIVHYEGEKSDENGNSGLLFTVPQFEMLLKNSNLGTEVDSDILRSLNGGQLTIECEYKTKGSKYIADENSTAVRNGSANVGDTLEKELSGYIYGDLTKGNVIRNPNNEMIFGAINKIANNFTKMFSGIIGTQPQTQIESGEGVKRIDVDIES